MVLIMKLSANLNYLPRALYETHTEVSVLLISCYQVTNAIVIPKDDDPTLLLRSRAGSSLHPYHSHSPTLCAHPIAEGAKNDRQSASEVLFRQQHGHFS